MQKVVTKEVVDAVPTGRLGINLAALQPGIILGAGGGVGQANTNALTSQDVGGTAGDTFTDLSIHGGKPAEQRQTIGGLSAATTIRFGESLSSSPSFTAMQEMSVNTSGADASMAGGGVQINYVPRDGGNTFKGLLFFSCANGGMQGTNYSSGTRDATGACTPADSLFCRGLMAQPGALKNVYDFNPGFGGPIVKDKLWFFGTARWTKAENYVPNEYPNKNFVVGQTSPTLLNTTTLTYNPDTSAAVSARRSAAAATSGSRRCVSAGRWTRRTSSGSTTTTRSGNTPTSSPTTSQEALATDLLLPVLGQPGAVVGAADQPAAARGRRSGAIRRPGATAAPTATIVDPLAVGITDNNPQTLVPDYVQLIQNYHGRVGATDTPSHNPNCRGNFATVVRHGLALVQDRLRPERRDRVGGHELGRSLQLRREHAGQ